MTIRCGAALVLTAALAACTSGPTIDDAPYAATVQKDRADKDVFFRSAGGPIPAEKRATFTGLSYFPIDSSYREVTPVALSMLATGGQLTATPWQLHTTFPRVR